MLSRQMLKFYSAFLPGCQQVSPRLSYFSPTLFLKLIIFSIFGLRFTTNKTNIP